MLTEEENVIFSMGYTSVNQFGKAPLWVRCDGSPTYKWKSNCGLYTLEYKTDCGLPGKLEKKLLMAHLRKIRNAIIDGKVPPEAIHDPIIMTHKELEKNELPITIYEAEKALKRLNGTFSTKSPNGAGTFFMVEDICIYEELEIGEWDTSITLSDFVKQIVMAEVKALKQNS